MIQPTPFSCLMFCLNIKAKIVPSSRQISFCSSCQLGHFVFVSNLQRWISLRFLRNVPKVHCVTSVKNVALCYKHCSVVLQAGSSAVPERPKGCASDHDTIESRIKTVFTFTIFYVRIKVENGAFWKNMLYLFPVQNCGTSVFPAFIRDFMLNLLMCDHNPHGSEVHFS